MSRAPQPGLPSPPMIQNSIDVGIEVNKLRSLPMLDAPEVLMSTGSMTMEEAEIVWPYLSTAGRCLMMQG